MKTKKRTQKNWRQFPSIKSAASGMGISETLLKAAKAMGCEAFKARGSIDEKTLSEFIAANKDKLAGGGILLRDQKLTEEVRKLRIKNDREEGKLIAVETIREALVEIMTGIDQILEQKLANEYPSAVAGLDVPQARVYGKRLGDQIREMIQRLADRWKTKAPNAPPVRQLPERHQAA